MHARFAEKKKASLMGINSTSNAFVKSAKIYAVGMKERQEQDMNRRSYKGTGNPAFKHGLHKSPTWFSWTFMKQRCRNPKRSDYKYYGGRGITYDPRWETLQGFICDMGMKPNFSLTLDRIDPNGNYCKSNCRWATREQQALNRRPCTTIIPRDLFGRFVSAPKSSGRRKARP